jgi:isopropylmalate/homocitrate/citramalate synthase
MKNWANRRRLEPIMNPIVVHEVGPRDGLQMERRVVPTGTREEWVRRIMASGVDIVQVGSFVHPAKVPQMADSDELIRRLVADKPPAATIAALALNERGVERGMECGVEMFCLGASASDTHSRRNTRMSSMEATRRIAAAGKEALAAGRKVQVSVQSAFGCGFEGTVSEKRVLSMVHTYIDAGLFNISLADTAGHAHPAQVERLFGAVLESEPRVECTCHFHDTYGLGMANIFAALRVGVTSFETSFAGLGGCPFTRVAAGNVATEDFVNALQLQGMREDICLDALVGVANDVAGFFKREMPGCVYKTGPGKPGGAA